MSEESYQELYERCFKVIEELEGTIAASYVMANRQERSFTELKELFVILKQIPKARVE